MTDEQLYENLYYLANKYTIKSSKKNTLLHEIEIRGFNGVNGVNGVLHEISSSEIGIDRKDSELIKDIAFYFA
ncbi:hypothetical protein EKN09_11820 [Vibrio penaeicida]|uniref:Uncharacterized protein n=1 Tax=Vibrio penaeicida TaxID=104609 RepID=A0AAV5NVF7_9VIBR|nr:hypothetical protein EKN09_11820 [Vibrio penaeicida]GLQ74339.1 hypothetical protein GCM10007932_37000 [Vibrio penaeicida]